MFGLAALQRRLPKSALVALGTSLSAHLLAGLGVYVLAVRWQVLSARARPAAPDHVPEVDVQLLAMSPPVLRPTTALARLATVSGERAERARERAKTRPPVQDTAPPDVASTVESGAELATVASASDAAPATGPAAATGAGTAASGTTGAGTAAPGTTRAGTIDGVPAETVAVVLPFGEGMTRPRRIAGEPPRYTAEARAAHVEGKVLVRCVITERGNVRDCKIIAPLPMLDQAAVRALLASRFTPATFRGRPLAVRYLFTFDFRMP